MSGELQNPLAKVTSTSSSSKTKMKHFVDKHREELIQRIPLSDPILDGLLSKDLLTYEQYDAIRCSGTPQDKMRRLYSYINGWGDNDKDFLYKVLKRNYRAVIEHLERS